MSRGFWTRVRFPSAPPKKNRHPSDACFFFSLADKVAHKYDCKDNHEDDCRQSVDLGADALLDHGIDGDRERLYVSCGKIADHEIVQRVSKCHQKARNNAGHDLGKHDLHKRLGRRTAEIECRLIKIAVHLSELRKNGKIHRKKCERSRVKEIRPTFSQMKTEA